MALGMFVMGTLPQVARPAILIVVPSVAKGTVIIDAGANVDCKPRHLVQFGLMMSHSVHHRGQLGVYFRLRGVPIPGVYGPSADD